MKSRTRPAAAETDFSVKTNSISTSVASGPEATGRSVSNGVRESEGGLLGVAALERSDNVASLSHAFAYGSSAATKFLNLP